MPNEDYRYQIAESANEALDHQFVLEALDAFIREIGASSLRGQPYAILRDLMCYAAIIARAQALGIDPEHLRRDATIPVKLADQISRANQEGTPLYVIQSEEDTYDA